MKRETHKIQSMAAALYDGGWRADDRETFAEEYDLDEEGTDKICEELTKYK